MPDPDNMNGSRAEWAGAALSTFMNVTGTCALNWTVEVS